MSDSVWGVNPPTPERNTACNKGRKCFHCLGAPNNLIRPCIPLAAPLRSGYMLLDYNFLMLCIDKQKEVISLDLISQTVYVNTKIL